jgi:hypothetical protein
MIVNFAESEGAKIRNPCSVGRDYRAPQKAQTSVMNPLKVVKDSPRQAGEALSVIGLQLPRRFHVLNNPAEDRMLWKRTSRFVRMQGIAKHGEIM